MLPADATSTESIDNSVGSFDWAVGSDLGSEATYGLRIGYDEDESVFQYSFPFAIEGGSGSSTASGTATGSSPTSTSKGNFTTITSTYKTSHTSATVTHGSNHTTTRGSTGGAI